MTDVFFIEAHHTDTREVMARKLEALWHKSGLASRFAPKDLTALKLHVGEPGTKTFISPSIAGALVDCLQSSGCTVFLTDTAVLYRSPRDNAIGHIKVAMEHGFGLTQVGAPFFPADGLRGDHGIDVAVDGKHHKKVSIAAGILEARSLLVLSHATGHLGTGFGGALKNLGMGCATKKGKLQQHHGQQPHVNEQACTCCGVCEKWCPSEAISVGTTAVIDAEKCIGCGECVAVCRDNAIAYDWGIMGKELQERIVEHAAAVVRHHRSTMACVTAAIQITKDCDCLGVSQKGLVPDIGILASTDPVALDQAVHDLICERAGRTLESMSYPSHDGTVQMRYAQELGLGSQSYTLVPLTMR
ncbi:MAG: DUF362 domain-containing protein [Myxococcota bacterium]|jgi:hypothetical protein|nr:DUF362 domain-containing protein [Myxococcota bacterium]